MSSFDIYSLYTYETDSSLYNSPSHSNYHHSPTYTEDVQPPPDLAQYEEYEDRPIEYAQPPPAVVVHPNSMAAELGLTTEELALVLQDQEEWMREEEQGYEVEEHTTGEAQ